MYKYKYLGTQDFSFAELQYVLKLYVCRHCCEHPVNAETGYEDRFEYGNDSL